jgi:EAL and modified HD-GYP domain-containing signal transduction protein
VTPTLHRCSGRCHFEWFAGHLPQSACDQATKAAEAPNRSLLLELLSQVVNDADSRAIETTVKRDPQLSYHLLKLVNSVAFSPRAKIASFGQAIALLGRRQLQRWLQLLLYASTQQEGMSNLFLPQAAMRAGLAEALCARSGGNRETQDRAFMAGMFSLLDRVFGMSLADIVRPLNLADDVTQALTEGSGPLGVLLRAVAAGEAPPGDALAAILEEAGISHEGWARSVIHACGWAVQVSREA